MNYGIILIKINNINISDINIENIEYSGINIKSFDDIKNISKNYNNINFLLINYKYSIGYTNFINGNYEISNINNIINLFQQMTKQEIDKIKNIEFDILWNELNSIDIRDKSELLYIYKHSFKKYTLLKNKIGTDLDLDFYINKIVPIYNNLEWGFPKGQKYKNETEQQAALRNLYEETKINNVKILTNIKPIYEILYDINNNEYTNIYYIAILQDNTMKINTPLINFFNYDSTIDLIRNYDIDKKIMIQNIFIFFMNIFIYNKLL